MSWFLAMVLLFAAGRDRPADRPADRQAAAAAADTMVVLLHGLARSPRSMGRMAEVLRESGYTVVNLGYPSTDHTVPELADTLAARLDRCCRDATVLHFVTHSLGGILVRLYQADRGAGRIGRVVMLAPPNRGSEVVDRIPDGLLRLVMGPGVVQLGTDSASVVHELPPVEFELGIIAGTASFNPIFSWWLSGEDDGKVTVQSAVVDGATDSLIVPFTHAFIMQRGRVIEETLRFLETGRFSDTTTPGDTFGLAPVGPRQ